MEGQKIRMTRKVLSLMDAAAPSEEGKNRYLSRIGES